MKVKGLVFIGSRANYGRLYMVLKEMLEHADWLDFKIFLAASGTYLDIEGFYGYVDYIVDGVMYKDTVGNIVETMSIVQSHASNYLSNHYYDFCLIHGDRFENLAFAFSAFFNGCPIVHTEGGENSGGFDNTVRDIISRLASIHCVTTNQCAKKLLDINIPINKYIVGSPTIDYVFNVLERRGVDYGNPYAVVLYNPLPYENYSELLEAILMLTHKIKIYWVNPNVDPGFKNLIYRLKKLNVEFVKDLKPRSFIKLLNEAHLLIGNTSAGIKEGAAIGIPYILVGDRQKGRETASNVYRHAMNHEHIYKEALNFIDFNQTKIPYDGTFGNGDASRKILKIIKEVFRKNG